MANEFRYDPGALKNYAVKVNVTAKMPFVSYVLIAMIIIDSTIGPRAEFLVYGRMFLLICAVILLAMERYCQTKLQAQVALCQLEIERKLTEALAKKEVSV